METKHVVHERFVHEPADGERTRVRWNLPLGLVLVLLPVGYVAAHTARSLLDAPARR